MCLKLADLPTSDNDREQEQERVLLDELLMAFVVYVAFCLPMFGKSYKDP
jgi:hypothetical protein